MYELDPDDYYKARTLFKELQFNVAIDAIIDGTIPGKIWVDDLQAPQTAFAWNRTADGDWYLEGDAHNEALLDKLNTLILQSIYPLAKTDPHTADFTLRYFPQHWKNLPERMLRGTNPRVDTRQFFLFKHLAPNWRTLLPEGYSLQQIDATLWQREELRVQILKSWSSIELFQKQGFGFCLLRENDIVSRCLTDWTSGIRCDLGIQTDERYRRRGFATLVAAATVEYALAHAYTFIGWHCWISNVASASTAQKVGFEKVLEQPVFHAWYNQCDNALVQAWEHFQAQDYTYAANLRAKALDMFEKDDEDARTSRFLSSPEARQWFYMHSAFISALAGMSDSAMKLAQTALRLGLSESRFEHMKQEGAFKIPETELYGERFFLQIQQLFA